MTQKKIPLVPLGDKIILKVHIPETKSAGGILLTETKTERPIRGTVVAVGPGKLADDNKTLLPLIIKVGDEVIFSSYSTENIQIDGQEYLIIKEESILAKVLK